MRSVFRLLRIQQWVKGIFCFFPIFFGGYIFDIPMVFATLVAVSSYCLMASSIYCFNDIWDAEADRLHPAKRKRPVASGAVSVKAAYLIMAILAVAAISLCFLLPSPQRLWLIAVLAAYYILNIAYCTWLKRLPLIDVTVISVGFVLRVIAGGVAMDVELSRWLLVLTFLLALFIAIAKRRDDVAIFESTGKKIRSRINRYNLQFMNQILAIVGAVMLATYLMYVLNDNVVARYGTKYVCVTFIFVLLGIFRYLQLTIVDQKTASPTKAVMKDKFITLCIIGWLMVYGVLIYLN